jgi:hypothetical protein
MNPAKWSMPIAALVVSVAFFGLSVATASASNRARNHRVSHRTGYKAHHDPRAPLPWRQGAARLPNSAGHLRLRVGTRHRRRDLG